MKVFVVYMANETRGSPINLIGVYSKKKVAMKILDSYGKKKMYLKQIELDEENYCSDSDSESQSESESESGSESGSESN